MSWHTVPLNDIYLFLLDIYKKHPKVCLFGPVFALHLENSFSDGISTP